MLDALIEFLRDAQTGISEIITNDFLSGLIQVTVVVLVVFLVYLGCRIIYGFIRRRVDAAYAPHNVCRIIVDSGALPRALLMIPVISMGFLSETLLPDAHAMRTVLLKASQIGFYFVCAHIFSAVLDAAYHLVNLCRGVSASPQKGVFQILKVLGYCFAAVAIVAVLSGRNPMYILSGLTALSAVLMLVFKDSILGLTAGVTLAGNGMIRIGDWIEVPAADADGEVIDVALTTIRVQNWDKTITTIPAYDLLAKPFKNWRGMSEAGGRRIKRSIVIDMDSVGFATEKQLEAWKEIDLLRDYLAQRLQEVRAYNNAHPSSRVSVINARKLTNLGTFRAYCEAYLHAHPQVRQDLTVMTRQLQSNERGIPLEIYCFTTVTEWGTYENIQSDIFDRLLAILPEFGLRTFQLNSAAAMRAFTESIRSAKK